jgi:hypothetical protein
VESEVRFTNEDAEFKKFYLLAAAKLLIGASCERTQTAAVLLIVPLSNSVVIPVNNCSRLTATKDF